MSDLAYWLGLNLVQNIGPVRIRQLLDYFGSPARAWHASERDLRDAGLPENAARELIQQRNRVNLERELMRIEQSGAKLVTIEDDAYPQMLRKIVDAPPVLYVRGEMLPEDVTAVAVVGTRKASRYGIDVARKLSREMSANGITVISGLALGIDSAAHEGALNAKGRTIAVLGNGIDRIYPAENRTLSERITHRGAIISEFRLGTPPSAHNFPRRNRLMSGLALAVLVVEAPERSGALITAETALEQGREVFAIPANIFNPAGTGTNRLIQDGAKLVTGVEDILNELDVTIEHMVTHQQTQTIAPGNDTEKLLLNILDVEPIHIDDIIRISKLSTDNVISTLTILELKGLAQQVGPMQYCRPR